MNKSKGGKVGNKKTTKTPATSVTVSGGNEKKKPPSRKNKSNNKNGKKPNTNTPDPNVITVQKELQCPDGRKLERSNSFISRGLSKLYNTLAGSRDAINKSSSGESIESHDKVPEPPTFLRRSRTLGTISLRKQRRSMPTPLEQLTEETDHRPSEEEHAHQKMHSVDESSEGMMTGFGGSRESLGTSILGRLKRTFSITSDRRRHGINQRWSASLQSLQQLDNMVSYEDPSFINYDEFNQIEKQVNRALSQLDVREASTVDAPPKVPEVVKRIKKPEKRVSYKCQSDWDANFDMDKNLYRQSLDSEKLQTLSRVNRKSFRWSNVFEPVPTEYLQLDTVQSSRRVSFSSDTTTPWATASTSTPSNHIRSLPNVSSGDVLPQDLWAKSRSLTHLDSLDLHQENLNEKISGKVSPNSSNTRHPNFFTIVFNPRDKEFIPISDGVPLNIAVRSSLAKRNLTFSQLSIHEDCAITADTPSYLKLFESLDKDINVRLLAGKTLYVTEKSPKTQKTAHSLRKASSVGSRRSGDAAASFDEALSDPKVQAKSRSISNFNLLGSSLWGIKYVQQSGLIDILNEFMVYGIPNARSSYTCNHPVFEVALNYLGHPHNTWREFVNCEGLTDLEKLIQSRLWEIVITEVKYIFALQTVTDHFLACMNALNARDMLLEINKKKLFSNIWELCEANLTFWTTFVYPMVRHSIDTGEPLNISFIEAGFLAFAEIFEPYKTFCSEQTQCLYYCKHLARSNIFFAAYLKWCEAHELCRRLKLADILVTPMQRLTKYSLLLKTIKQDLGGQKVIENLDEMIEAVGGFVNIVDSSVSEFQGTERLRGVIARIDGYDVVEKSGDTLDCMAKQYSSMFDLSDSIEGCAVETTRHVFMEGDLKFKDSTGKFDVHCFLLTDILLVCRINTKKTPCELKVCRTPFFTDRLKTMLRDETVYCVYLNEFNLVSTAFSLQCSEAKSWYETLEKARQMYTRLKQGHKSCIDGKSSGQSVKTSPKSAGSSQSSSIELNELKAMSVDIERTNSMSSDEGAFHGAGAKPKMLNLPKKPRSKGNSPVLFEVKQSDNKGQSMPDLYSSFVSHSHSNTLLVPGTSSAHGSFLSPSNRGISYPPPSPTRATLKRGLAFSFTTKNPPLVKTKNITSQNVSNCDQTPAPSGPSGSRGNQEQPTPRECVIEIDRLSSQSWGDIPKEDKTSSSNVSDECDGGHGVESTV